MNLGNLYDGDIRAAQEVLAQDFTPERQQQAIDGLKKWIPMVSQEVRASIQELLMQLHVEGALHDAKTVIRYKDYDRMQDACHERIRSLILRASPANVARLEAADKELLFESQLHYLNVGASARFAFPQLDQAARELLQRPEIHMPEARMRMYGTLRRSGINMYMSIHSQDGASAEEEMVSFALSRLGKLLASKQLPDEVDLIACDEVIRHTCFPEGQREYSEVRIVEAARAYLGTQGTELGKRYAQRLICRVSGDTDEVQSHLQDVRIKGSYQDIVDTHNRLAVHWNFQPWNALREIDAALHVVSSAGIQGSHSLLQARCSALLRNLMARFPQAQGKEFKRETERVIRQIETHVRELETLPSAKTFLVMSLVNLIEAYYLINRQSEAESARLRALELATETGMEGYRLELSRA
jgi:hypothetical protein